MSIAESLLPEYDHELATTRRVLERVPESEFAWKPHAKSMSLGQLAGHVANLPWWLSMTLAAPFYDLNSQDKESRLDGPASKDALLKEFDEKVKNARASLAKASDAEMMAPWTLRAGDNEIFTIPRVAAVRSFVMNHLIHHRGQLSVYLRLKDVPVPSIYGPTADEQ
ncbi:MAG TPA: DinB family protein [Vicinamibacterales bacterium]